jgi:hypothetical protein
MRNKIITIILFIAIIPFGFYSQNSQSDQQKILGQWHLCKIYNGKIATNFNVCPDLYFKKDSTGFLQTNSIYEFNWSMTTNVISLKFNKKLDDKDIMLRLSDCTVKYNYDEKSEYLELENSKSSIKYILSRNR